VCFAAVCVALGNYLVGRRRGEWLALGLCFVTGLDLLPIGWLEAQGMHVVDMEWWSPGQVTAITGFLAWVPQHATAALYVLVCQVLLGLLDDPQAAMPKSGLLAVILLATASGMTSTYVGELLFGLLLASCLVGMLRRRTVTASSLRSGVVFAVGGFLLVPFYWHLLTIDQYQGPSQLPLFRPFAGERYARQLPPFDWFEQFRPYFGAVQAYRLFTLPVQYALEFGFGMIVGIAWLVGPFQSDRRDAVLARLRVLVLGALLAASVLVSVRKDADLNWRMLHLVQGALIAVGALFLSRPLATRPWAAWGLRYLVAATLCLGVLGTLYNFYALRFGSWDSPIRELSLAGRAADASPQIEALTASAARVQYNPTANPPWQIYLSRPCPIADSGVNSVIFGVSREKHAAVHEDIASIFQRELGPAERERTLRDYQIDYLLVQQEDPIFAAPLSALFLHTPPIVCRSEE
jgi:hypothetical protein